MPYFCEEIWRKNFPPHIFTLPIPWKEFSLSLPEAIFIVTVPPMVKILSPRLLFGRCPRMDNCVLFLLLLIISSIPPVLLQIQFVDLSLPEVAFLLAQNVEGYDGLKLKNKKNILNYFLKISFFSRLSPVGDVEYG